ncbi:MAG: hypothetical protein AAGD04_14815, partial [Pseudomonadota bacterium]
MTRIAPISRATLDAVLLNEHGESVLTLGEGPQSLTLELTNLAAQDISMGKSHKTVLVLTFRPGALVNPDKITVSSPGWKLTRQGTHLPSLVLTHTGEITLEPDGDNSKHRITLNNLNPSAHGASRSTRVEMAYQNIKVAGGDPLNGRRTIHLSLLYPNVPMGKVLGQSGQTGSFKVELLSSADVITGGKLNKVRLRLSTTAPVPVQSMARGADRDEIPKLGMELQGTSGDHLQFAVPDNAFEIPTRWTPSKDQAQAIYVSNTLDDPIAILEVQSSGKIRPHITIAPKTA